MAKPTGCFNQKWCEELLGEKKSPVSGGMNLTGSRKITPEDTIVAEGPGVGSSTPVWDDLGFNGRAGRDRLSPSPRRRSGRQRSTSGSTGRSR